jgi:hypothetical protein
MRAARTAIGWTADGTGSWFSFGGVTAGGADAVTSGGAATLVRGTLAHAEGAGETTLTAGPPHPLASARAASERNGEGNEVDSRTAMRA